MQIELFLKISRVGAPFIVGILFIASYFLADKNEFFHFLAYFPRKREGSIRIGSLVFGAAFILIAIYNLFITFW
jgi:hypothetical protein